MPAANLAHLDAYEHWRDPLGNTVVLGDNLAVLEALAAGCVDLIYIDPPFNTGVRQTRRTFTVTRAGDEAGAPAGFQGRGYKRTQVGQASYGDSRDDYLDFLRARLVHAHRALADDGSLLFHIDWRQSAYCRLLLEEVFGDARCCINEIIWAYDYGARSKKRWPTKHDTIYWFAKDPGRYVFDIEAADRIPYMAPGLVTKEKAARGKTPTDTWWHTIVPTNSKEKTGYPSQKPLGIVERIVKVHSRPGDLVMDFFAGSGTTGMAARRHKRRYLLVDDNPQAYETMTRRLA